MPSLKPLNPDMPAQLADLPGELLREIVREAAVQKPEPISVIVMDAEINTLLKPFADFPLLLDIAETEVMRVNAFSVSFKDWDINVRWPGDHLMRNSISSSDSDSVSESDSDSDSNPDLSFESAVSRPCLSSMRHGLIGEKSHLIRHMQVDLQVALRGALFRGKDKPSYCEPEVIEDCIMFFRSLSALFPVLKTLNVNVDNQGVEDPDDGRYYLIEPEISLENRRDPRFWKCEMMEKMMAMEYFLLLTVDARTTPPLRKKTVTFVQNPWYSDSYPTFDDKAFRAVQHADDCEDDLSDLEHARAAALFCEMLGRENGVLRAVRALRYCGKTQERKEIYESGVGKTDLELLQQILKTPKAAVELP